MHINKRFSYWGFVDKDTILPQEMELEKLYESLYPIVNEKILKEDYRRFKNANRYCNPPKKKYKRGESRPNTLNVLEMFNINE